MRALPDAASRLLRLLPPETAHRLSLRLLAWAPRALVGTSGPDDPILASRAFGLDFPNPVGLAAGYDKNAEVFGPALRLGFGFVEIGSVTPRPQAGNPQPRLFRLTEDRAVINRMGFNNDGLDCGSGATGTAQTLAESLAPISARTRIAPMPRLITPPAFAPSAPMPITW